MEFKEQFKKASRTAARNTFYVLRWIISRLPYPVFKGLASFFVTLGQPLLLKKKKIALENLQIAFGKEYSKEKSSFGVTERAVDV